MKFIDEVTIDVASGKGGPGCVSFRREIFVPRGGPDGGDGGKGGSVIFKTSTRLHSLLDLRLKRKYKAEDGEAGKNQNRAGADGKDLIIMVPQGTIIKDVNGAIIRDLNREEEFTFLEGGLGGRGNPFYKSSVNQAPSVAQKGLPGKEATVQLVLKLIADVGIIGFPNVGKSTLISAISSAKPKVADYPFTTLVPNLGVVRFREEQSYVVADMPGLIKGAHQGIGLGTRFLKHIERAKCFVHMIDGSGFSERDPVRDYKEINDELKAYDKIHEDEDGYIPLAGRQQLIVVNKADVLDQKSRDQLEKKFIKKGISVVFISAATGLNVKNLINLIGDMVFNGEDKKSESSPASQKKQKISVKKKINSKKGHAKKTRAKKIKIKKITRQKK